MGSWKAGSPASNPRRLKASKSWSSTILHWLSAAAWSQSIACNPKFGYHNSIFCKDDATTMKLVERAAALRDLKLLVGSGGLDFTRGMDSWTYMSYKSLFGSASPWAAERLAALSLLCSGLIAQLRAQALYCKESWRPQLRHQTLCFSEWDRCLFLKLQRRDGEDASTMQNWWSVLRLSGTSSFS